MSQEERAEELASELEEANDLLRDARTQCAHFAQRAEQDERALADKDQQIAMLRTLLHEARTQLHAAEEANESLRQECGWLQYEFDNAKDAQGQRDWLERQLHAAQEALRWALEYVVPPEFPNEGDAQYWDEAYKANLAALISPRPTAD